jgi:hypothetical protein
MTLNIMEAIVRSLSYFVAPQLKNVTTPHIMGSTRL